MQKETFYEVIVRGLTIVYLTYDVLLLYYRQPRFIMECSKV